MSSMGKILILIGAIIVLAGIFFALGGKLPWLGRLPGDIYIQKKGFSFFFPITTSIVISLAVSLVMIFLNKK